MPFADVGLALAWVMLAGWVLALGLVVGRGAAVGPDSALGRFPAAARRHPWIGTGIATGLFVAQAAVVDSVEDGGELAAADLPSHDWLVEHRTPALTTLARVLSAIGGAAGMAVLTVVAVALLARRRRWPDAVLVAVVAVGAWLMVILTKGLYARARPPVADRLAELATYSLPSGHALGSMAVLGVVTVMLLRQRIRRWWAIVVILAAAALIVGIGLSRLYLGVHWTSDVLAGWLLGGAWVALCVTGLLVWENRSKPAVTSSGAARTP